MKQTPENNQRLIGLSWKEYSPRELLEITTKMIEIRFEQNRIHRQTSQFKQKITKKVSSLYTLFSS